MSPRFPELDYDRDVLQYVAGLSHADDSKQFSDDSGSKSRNNNEGSLKAHEQNIRVALSDTESTETVIPTTVAEIEETNPFGSNSESECEKRELKSAIDRENQQSLHFILTGDNIGAQYLHSSDDSSNQAGASANLESHEPSTWTMSRVESINVETETIKNTETDKGGNRAINDSDNSPSTSSGGKARSSKTRTRDTLLRTESPSYSSTTTTSISYSNESDHPKFIYEPQITESQNTDSGNQDIKETTSTEVEEFTLWTKLFDETRNETENQNIKEDEIEMNVENEEASNEYSSDMRRFTVGDASVPNIAEEGQDTAMITTPSGQPSSNGPRRVAVLMLHPEPVNTSQLMGGTDVSQQFFWDGLTNQPRCWPFPHTEREQVVVSVATKVS